MFKESVDLMVASAGKKWQLLKTNPVGYWLSSMLAGIFVGFGITLIFAIGAPLAGDNSPLLKLVMGASFGVALTLVIFAGSELFTGNAMIMTFGVLSRQSRPGHLILIWLVSWLGNLVGALMLAWLVAQSGAVQAAQPFFAKVAVTKMNLPILDLILRGVLCNILVCLAVWMSNRTSSDGAKLALIWWCLFAFIGSGFEHSIANMSLLGIALFGNAAVEGLSWGGYFYNLLWVTLGNTLGAVLFLAIPYHVISRPARSI